MLEFRLVGSALSQYPAPVFRWSLTVAAHPTLFPPIMNSDEIRIHPTAIVAVSARLGTGIAIGPYSVIGDYVELGADCDIGPHVTILPHTTLGPRCRVHAGAVLGDLPQDQAYRDTESYVRIGAGCVIREHVTVHRGTRPQTATTIGDECLLMATSHVGHNAQVGNHVTLANGVLLAGYSEIGDRAFLSGHCLVHQFTRVGTLAMMSGGSAAQMDVPPFCITQTLVVNRVVGLNVVGLRRAGIPADERAALKSAFKLLYRSGLSVSSALEAIERLPTTAAVSELCRFIRQSKRGISKFFVDACAADTEGPDSIAA